MFSIRKVNYVKCHEETLTFTFYKFHGGVLINNQEYYLRKEVVINSMFTSEVFKAQSKTCQMKPNYSVRKFEFELKY